MTQKSHMFYARVTHKFWGNERAIHSVAFDSKNKHIYLNKKIDYVDNDSLDRGVVYTLNYI